MMFQIETLSLNDCFSFSKHHDRMFDFDCRKCTLKFKNDSQIGDDVYIYINVDSILNYFNLKCHKANDFSWNND